MSAFLDVLRGLTPTGEPVRTCLWVGAILCALFATCGILNVQAQAGCSANGYRVVTRHWDPVLKSGWELRQDCVHPDYPARLVAMAPGDLAATKEESTQKPAEGMHNLEPLMVTAGSPVRLWMQDDTVRIEMSGIAERSARKGERITVRVTHQSDETGLTVDHIAGVVRGSAEVEMDR